MAQSQTSVSQLLAGGLDAKFWQNQWLVGPPVIHRVDAQLSFNWGLNPVTSFGPGLVSARWAGKLLAPTTETFNIFLRAQGGIRLFLDHELIIEAWEENLRATKERMVLADLVEGTYHDIVLEYKEEEGPASVQMMWKSRTVAPSLIPASALFYATPISGSPFNTTVVPRGNGISYTGVHGEELPPMPGEEDSGDTVNEEDFSRGNSTITKPPEEALGLSKDAHDGATLALPKMMPDFPTVASTKASTVGVEHPPEHLPGPTFPAEAVYGPFWVDFPGVDSRQGLAPAAVSKWGDQVAEVFSRPHAARQTCGVDDAILSTAVDWMELHESEACPATFPPHLQGYHDGSTFAVPMNEPDLPAVAYALEVTTDAAPPPRPWPDALPMSQALTSSCVLCSVVPIDEKPVEIGVFWDPEPDEYRWVDALQVNILRFKCTTEAAEVLADSVEQVLPDPASTEEISVRDHSRLIAAPDVPSAFVNMRPKEKPPYGLHADVQVNPNKYSVEGNENIEETTKQGLSASSGMEASVRKDEMPSAFDAIGDESGHTRPEEKPPYGLHGIISSGWKRITSLAANVWSTVHILVTLPGRALGFLAPSASPVVRIAGALAVIFGLIGCFLEQGESGGTLLPCGPPPEMLRFHNSGLVNPGNQCATNAIIQLLWSNRALRNVMKEAGENPLREGRLAHSLGTLFKAMENPDNGPCKVDTTILGAISSSSNDQAGQRAIAGMQGGEEMECICSCGGHSNPSDTFVILTVPMKPLPADRRGRGGRTRSVELTDLLEEAKERIKSTTLSNCPDQLMLQLNRFSGDNRARREKLTYLVEIPRVLDVGRFTEVGRLFGESIIYDLQAVVHHIAWSGQPGDVESQGGHYVAFVRNPNDEWFLYDDFKVTHVSADKVFTSGAYVLSYVKRSVASVE
eukprot:jgi/Undpi1/3235/HiC_scaffold_15.g06609.m1